MPIRLDGRPTTGAQAAAVHLERAVQPDFDLLVRARDFPGVRPAQPVVRLFALPAVLDGLPEDAVLVAQPVAHGRELHRCHGFNEARCQASQPSVTQARVGLLFDQLEPIEILLRCRLLHKGVEQQVRDIVGQGAANEKLHRQVVNTLWILLPVGVLRMHPALREDIAHGAGDRLKTLARAGILQIDDMCRRADGVRRARCPSPRTGPGHTRID